MQTLGRQPRIIGIHTKFDGRYVLGNPPQFHKGRYTPAVQGSWKIVEAILTSRREAEFWVLAVAVTGHRDDGVRRLRGPQSIIRYFARNGWIKRVSPPLL